jgi:hypothetical protein
MMQGMDGTPHLTYFDRKHCLSFVWDGGEIGWIDVAYGGYAEPVIARIPISVDAATGIAALFMDFERACNNFIECIHTIERFDIEHAKEPRG